MLAAAFVLLILTLTMVVLPRKWYDVPNIDELVAYYVDGNDRPADEVLARDLALIHNGNWKKNELALRRMKWWLAGAVVALGLVVVCLVLGRV